MRIRMKLNTRRKEKIIDIKNKERAGDEALWFSVCLTCIRSWRGSPVPPPTRKRAERRQVLQRLESKGFRVSVT